MADLSSEPRSQNAIPLCVPYLQGNESKYLKECVDTNWVSSAGPFVTQFELMLSEYVGSNHAIATVNGTSALHVALLSAGILPNQEVLVSSFTFIAPANAIRYVGAWPVFIDSEYDYWQIDPDILEKFLRDDCRRDGETLVNKVTGREVAAILPVHILGHPCDMDRIMDLAHFYGLRVIEDATESLGARYNGKLIGTSGDVACFSFNGNKLITTGGGGMLVTDDNEIAQKSRYLTTQAKDDPWEYIHNSIGYNYRLSNVNAALGCAQMEQVEQYVKEKRRIAQIYLDNLNDIEGITPMSEAPWADSVYWMFSVLVEKQAFGIDSRQLSDQLKAHKIETRPLWQPCHDSLAHLECESRRNGVSNVLFEKGLSLPCSVGLSVEDQSRVITTLREISRD